MTSYAASQDARNEIDEVFNGRSSRDSECENIHCFFTASGQCSGCGLTPHAGFGLFNVTGVSVDALNVVKLLQLMKVTNGRADVVVGLIDGPVAKDHPDLVATRLRQLADASHRTCSPAYSVACAHGTFVAGMLFGRRQSGALSICPDCTLLVRPIFNATADEPGEMPNAEPEELATAITDCADAGASVLNLSVSLAPSSSQGERAVEQALDFAAQKSVLVVAAAGNEGTIYGSSITSHSWVIPVAACDLTGKPLASSNLSPSIGRRGLSAPGDRITSLGPPGKMLTLSGTSFAVPFVTGTIALLRSAFPKASVADVKTALVSSVGRRTTIVPPLLNAASAYDMLAANRGRMIT